MAIERIIADIQTASVRTTDDSVDGPGFVRVQQQVALLKARLDVMIDGQGRQPERQQYNKDLMPAIFGDGDH